VRPAAPVPPARARPPSLQGVSTLTADSAPEPAGSASRPAGRPSRAEIAAARDRTIPDLTGPGLRVLFCGINPSLYSAATGFHFARPGNRFWPALHDGGFTDRRLLPSEQHLLPGRGLGITNVVARATARADELDPDELRAGGVALGRLAAGLGVSWLAVLGVTAYRVAFDRPRAVVGPQPDRLGPARLWVLPNPSGLNAHWSAPALGEAFRELKLAVDAADGR
jgi:double-stranded uracil-DNA glycosylase